MEWRNIDQYNGNTTPNGMEMLTNGMEIQQQMEWKYINKWNGDTPVNGMDIHKQWKEILQIKWRYTKKWN
jgi:hypothetical protein